MKHKRFCSTPFLTVVFFFLFGLIALTGCSTTPFQNQVELEEQLAQWKDGPGLQYVVFDETGLLYSKVSGLKNIAAQQAMQARTRQMAYSMSKTFTAVLALKLAEEGLLDLEASATDYLPLIPYPKTLKVKHLLAQTSGIPNPAPLKWVHMPEDKCDCRAKLYPLLQRYSKLEFIPGEKYAYSNLSYWILEEIITKVTGQPFGQVMHEQLFSKAGLKSAEISYQMKGDEVAVGYLSNLIFLKLGFSLITKEAIAGKEERGWLRIRPHVLHSKGMGGIIASAESIALLTKEVVNAESKILGQKGQRWLFTVQTNSRGKLLPMTLGWHVKLKQDKVDYVYKEGGGASFHSEVRYYPDAKIGTVVMANQLRFDVKKFLNRADPLFLP